MMKKALQISIAQTLFTIEDDAYATLEGYLASVKDHFKHTEGHAEIIADIESRIAEQLHESKEKIVTNQTLKKILASIGSVEDFDDGEHAHEERAAEEKGPLIGNKRLYRNPDDKFIAGVCSGLAAYFRIEPVWIRLGFVVLSAFNGLGALVYLVLWIIVPEAKTRSQKLEMTGTPVTLSTISETVRERVAEVESTRPRLHALIALPFRFVGKILTFAFNIMSPVLRVSLGTILILAPMAALASVLVASGFLFSRAVWVANDIPLASILPQPLHSFALLGFMISAVIPLLFLLLGGISLLQRKNVVNVAIASSMLGTWFVALVVSGFAFATAATNYEEVVASSPAYKEVTQEIPLTGAFDKIALSQGMDVEVVRGTSPSLTAAGREKDMGRIEARVESGTLTLRLTPVAQKMPCLFCFGETPRLTLTVPALSDISATNGSTIHSNAFVSNRPIRMTFEDGSYGNFALTASELAVVATNGSSISFKGSAAHLDANLDHGSSLRAIYLETIDAVVNASNGSSAQLTVLETLKATATHGSGIFYTGNPLLTDSSDGSSSIRGSADE